MLQSTENIFENFINQLNFNLILYLSTLYLE